MTKTAFISGASRGIGKGIALALAEEGFDLAMTCRVNIDELQTLAQMLEKEYGIKTICEAGDMADYSFVQQFASCVLNKWEHIDVVINNAGIAYVGLICDMTEEEWNRMISVNLSSAFYTTKAFVPQMIRRKQGKIINISSMWGSAGASCEAAYSAAKGGLNSFTKALAKELAPSHIQVNALACGMIDTDMNAMFTEEEKADIVADIPADRMGTPADVGKAVLSLINGSDYMTAQIIGLDGGYL